ncbi:hypothetical protein ASC89_19715 [Devosia sp. Root413D1]|uniref:ADYC domain-containing protein n=1 Tax=unclassified Devosia TaxID=196773 RepID=UPI0006FBCAC6|nr:MULTISPECIES: ADYC domain-containing protein [unclassified Devosia]KQU97513.1 hypothetical protein ASC68_12000 [Devosia sp. Root105]KQW77411.1 hypothetical protein ASC89_19715 [Devosia sp. Root413D1]
MSLTSLCALLCTLLSIGPATAQTPPAPTVTAIEAAAGSFRATLSDGTTRQGTELIGMVLTYSDGDTTIRVKLKGVRPDPRDATGRLQLNDLRYADTDKPYCLPSADGLREGYAIAGRAADDGTIHPAEPGEFVLACTSGAQGKCLRFGYRPWEVGPDGVSNADRYNACIHMIRADYCGDGTATTNDGTLIDMFDDAGIQQAERKPGFSFEAAWTPEGAACVAHVRIRENISLADLARTCPRLAGKLGPEACSEGAVSADVYNLSK